MNPYLQLLATLFVVFRKARIEGLLSLDEDLECPEKSEVFNSFGEVDPRHEAVYTMIRDALRLMVAGVLNIQELDRYLTNYQEHQGATRTQLALMHVASEALVASAHGNAPQVAVEFGRICIPPDFRPSCADLEAFLREHLRKRREGGAGESTSTLFMTHPLAPEA